MTEYKVTFNQNVKLGQKPYRTGGSAIVDEGVLDELLVAGVISSDYETVTKAPEKPKTIEEMTVPELKEYATEKNIDLGDAKKRDELLEAIQAAEKDKDKDPENPPQD